MSKSGSAAKIKLNSFDDLFGSTEEKDDNAERIVRVKLTDLYEFKNHPFRVADDEKMEETTESIRRYGVLVPGIARPRQEGGYEIIAGHRRKRGSERAGKSDMPMIIRDCTDDEATILMIDSNIQWEDILPSEKAKAYKIKYDAMKNQGKAGNSLKMMSEESGENYKSIQRYIWLARLNDDLLALVDHKRLGLGQGVSLSVLTAEEQRMVYEALCRYPKKLSAVQANTIKQLSVDGKLDAEMLERYLISAQKQKRKKEITLKNERLSEYFEEETTEEEMMNIIFELLETWKRKKGSAQNE